MRPSVCTIYAFARTADDFADEGVRTQEERLQLLDEWRSQLDECYSGRASHPVFVALAETIVQAGIPRELLADLLTAFRVDVTQNRFSTFSDLLFYCKHSANPVGRLVLHVFNNATERTMALSDHICTALQLTNFWQDVSGDWLKGRIYIPLEDMRRFGYTESEIGRKVLDSRFRRMLRYEIDRTKAMFSNGKPLLQEATERLRPELRLTWGGGLKILRKIESSGYDVLTGPPRITLGDKLAILTKAILFR